MKTPPASQIPSRRAATFTTSPARIAARRRVTACSVICVRHLPWSEMVAENLQSEQCHLPAAAGWPKKGAVEFGAPASRAVLVQVVFAAGDLETFRNQVGKV